MEESKCMTDEDIGSMVGLPSKITNRDLNNHGEFSFEKLLKLSYPNDFKTMEKVPG
jgi:hypothetical protein